MRGVIRKFAEDNLIFLHRSIKSADITANNTATHMELISYNMLDVSRLRALKLASRSRYIAQTVALYVAFDVLLQNQLNFNVL